MYTILLNYIINLPKSILIRIMLHFKASGHILEARLIYVKSKADKKLLMEFRKRRKTLALWH